MALTGFFSGSSASLFFRTAVASVTIPSNSLVYVNAAGQLALADASVEGKEAIGFTRVIPYSVGQTVPYFTSGATMNSLVGLVPGTSYYTSAITPGVMTSAFPSSIGNVLQKVGIALSTTEVLFSPASPITL